MAMRRCRVLALALNVAHLKAVTVVEAAILVSHATAKAPETLHTVRNAIAAVGCCEEGGTDQKSGGQQKQDFHYAFHKRSSNRLRPGSF
jgi:hypothetical protein